MIKKKMLLSLALVLASSCLQLSAQRSNTQSNGKEHNYVYNMAMVEEQPEFPGGSSEMYKWIGDNINYPAQALEDSVQGRVIVEFVVSKTGQVENPYVLRSRHPALDKEALRVVKAMPKWKPGRNNGKPVGVIYTIPVIFKIADVKK